jgi:hypothetical protein
MVQRPDVVLHENNPALMQSGFSASVEIPKSQSVGEYYLKTIKRDNSHSQTYLPGITVRVNAVVSSSQGPIPIKKTPEKKPKNLLIDKT